MADEPTTDPDAPAEQPHAAPSRATSEPESQTAAKPDDGLGDAGKRALDEERRTRRAAEKRLKDMETELEQLRQKGMSESERAIAEARAMGRREALAESTNRLVRAELRAAAAGKLADPDDAALLLGDLSEYVTDNGDVNVKAIAKAIDALVEMKPYLAPQQAKPAPLPGGGATPSNGFSMDDFIRQSARSR